MTQEQGLVQNVLVHQVGDVLAADVAIGAATITVVDAADFSEDGGTLLLDAETIDYDSCDDESGVITLAAVTTAAHVAGDEVFVFPLAYEKVAAVSLSADEEPIEARVPHALWDKLAEGVRVDEAEQVLLEHIDEDDFELVDVLGTTPIIEGTYLDTSTLAPLPSSALVNVPPPAIDDLESGTYHGTMLVSGAITTRDVDPVTGFPTGPGQDLSPSGFFSYGPVDGNGNEQRRAEMPTDPDLPHVFRGDAWIERLTVATFTALAQSSLAENAVMTLLSGIVAPTQPPTIAFDWSQVQLAQWDGTEKGVGWDGTHVVTCLAALSGGDKIVQFSRYNPANGALVDYAPSGPLSVGWNAILLYSSCADATYGYALIATITSKGLEDHYDVVRVKWSDGTTETSSWSPKRGTKYPAIGVDGSDILIAENRDNTDGLVHINRFTFVAGGALAAGTAITTNKTMNSNLASVVYSPTDFAAARYVVSSRTVTRAVFSTAGTEQTAETWPNPDGGSGKLGDCWNGTTWLSVDLNGVLTTYEADPNLRWTSSTLDTWYAAIAWRNSAGVYETQRSPLATFTMKKRARVRITAIAPPMGGSVVPTHIRFFLYRGTPAPAAGAMFLQTDIAAVADTLAQLVLSAPVFSSPTHDVTTNTFPGGLPSSIEALIGGFVIDAESDGDVGTGTFRDSVRAAANSGIVDYGAASGTTDVNGDIVVNHDLGVTPTVALATLKSAAGMIRSVARSSTTVTYRIHTTAGAVAASAARDFDWEVRA